MSAVYLPQLLCWGIFFYSETLFTSQVFEFGLALFIGVKVLME